MGRSLFIILGLLLGSGLPPARAATFSVSTTNDTHSTGFSSQGSPGSTSPADGTGHISLRSALEYASTVAGATTINLPAGTYNLTLGDLVAGTAANTAIYLHGQGTPTNTLVHQTVPHDLVWVVNYNLKANVIFSLDNVTVSGGNEDINDPDGFGGNGGAILAGGSVNASGNVLNLTNVVFTGNYTAGDTGGVVNGGAVSMTGGGDLNVVNCAFLNNQSAKIAGTGFGGAIWFDNSANPGDVVISGTLFSNSIASGGEAGAVGLSGGSAGVFTLTANSFVSNSCASGTTSGGAIYVSSGNLTGDYNRFKGNQAAIGGAVYIASTGLFSAGDLRNCWWGGNGGPNTSGSDTTFPVTGSIPPLGQGQIAFNPWLELSLDANPQTILVDDSSVLTASFQMNSGGAAIAAANLAALTGLPVTFTNPLAGSISGAQSFIQSSGTATATFTAGATGGFGSAEVEVDNAALTVPITVVAGAAPQLHIARSGTNVVIFWPTNFQGFTLQYSVAPLSNVWSNYTGPSAISGGNILVTNAAVGMEKIYRLKY